MYTYIIIYIVHTWGVHEVKVDKIVDSKLLQLKYHRTQVRPEDFWIRVFLHLTLVGSLCVEAETLAWSGTASPACPLLGTGLTNRRHQERLHTNTGVVHLTGKKNAFQLFVSHMNFDPIIKFPYYNLSPI